MPIGLQPKTAGHRDLFFKLLVSTAVVALAAGCSKSSQDRVAKNLRSPSHHAKSGKRAAGASSPLAAATTYWAGRFRKNPKDAEAAYSYAMNLKAMGDKKRAMDILKAAHTYHPADPQIASEFGRLALDMNKLALADQMLQRAEASKKGPDWRVLSARGTLHAKKGDYGQAQHYFEAALAERPDKPSILNNLALAYALDGKADRAEPILRQAMASGKESPKIRQNLALVLGLQGKFGEARQVAAVDLSGDQAGANASYLRNMVRDEIKIAGAEKVPVPVPASAEKPGPNVHLANVKREAAARADQTGAKPVSLAAPPPKSDWSTKIIEPNSAKKPAPADRVGPPLISPFRR